MDQPRALSDAIDDLPTARALIASLQEQLTTSQREIAALRHELDILCQRLFGRKSERVDPRQLKLALEQLANERGPVTEPVEMDSGETPVRGHARRRPTGRRPLPAHLPRRRVEIDVTDAEKQCACGHTRTRIGEDVSEKLEYEPASFVVIETVRPKYACPHCHEGVVEAPAPPQAIEKSLAAEGLLAHVVVSKYVDHLPLHRLERIFAREAIDLPRSTLCDWVADVATALSPIAEQLRREVTAADYLQTDDTTITVLADRGGSFKGRIWTYLDPLANQVVFDATTTHERDGPAAFLVDFRGKLQADAYSGYDALYQTGRVIEIGCWAHARRRFVEAFMIDRSAALMIALIQQLYQVERDAIDLDPESRRALRQEQTVPLLAKIDAERQALARTVLPKSPVGEAVRYLTNQWAALQRFAEDGRLAADNNRAENQLRLVAVGRKNWLFAGSFEGARRAALLYSLVQSCKLVDVPPFAYLKDVLIRVATHPHRLIHELTPKAWAWRFHHQLPTES
ncbi:MAG TPA: IS66 family transposase [Gemmatimonadales bacterium]|nr:IS66 family transposase [Gemmatimonadales bacterium]